MIYRDLGKTGLRVSQLGFGCMRFPMLEGGKEVDLDKTLPILERAYAGGVNYYDTAVFYCEGKSEAAVGEFIKDKRDKVIVSTKNAHYGDEAEWRRLLEQSLTRLQTDYIDLYNYHAINWDHFSKQVQPRLYKMMQQAKDEGLIRHICLSFHDTPDALVRIIEAGCPEVITIQYNLLDQGLSDAITLAHERGIGVVGMGPVGGGRLGTNVEVFQSILPDIRRVPELALRFVLSNPGVTLALSGMSTMEQVEENLAIAATDRPFTSEELAMVNEHIERLQKMSDLYCSGCGYCMPCPQGVDIPFTFQKYNEGRVYGFWKDSWGHYKFHAVDGKRSVEQCTQCGVCEPKCPQKIAIPQELVRADKALRDHAGE